MLNTKCPDCSTGMKLPEDINVGAIIICPECDIRLEVENTIPGKNILRPAYCARCS